MVVLPLLLPEETGWNGFRVARRLWALDLPLIFCSLAFSESFVAPWWVPKLIVTKEVSWDPYTWPKIEG